MDAGVDAFAGVSFLAGTTSVNAVDKEGWVVSITPSGGWVPAFIAGKSGIGLSQRMQSYVLDAAENPFKHGTFWGAAGNHGEDYGIGW